MWQNLDRYMLMLSPSLPFGEQKPTINENHGNLWAAKEGLNGSMTLKDLKMDAAETNRLLSKSIRNKEIGTSRRYTQLENQEYSSSSSIHSFSVSSTVSPPSLSPGQNHSILYLFERHNA